MNSIDRPGIVSLWLFREREDPADSGKDVLRDFCGIDDYDLDQQEGAVGADAEGIHSLVGQLSYAESFCNEAVAAAERLGVSVAYGVLAQYDYAFDPAAAGPSVVRDPIFLGCFRYHQ